jgi:DNA-binding Lrp family transcriptional regulator
VLVNLANLPRESHFFLPVYSFMALLLFGQANITHQNSTMAGWHVAFSGKSLTLFLVSIICVSLLTVGVAWAVPEARADGVGEHLARRPEVTHCYLRAPGAGWPFNLYAMVHGPSEESCRRFVERVTGEMKLEPPAILPTVRELKRAPLPLAEG